MEERWLRKLADIPKPSLSLYSMRSIGFDYDTFPGEMPADTYKISDLDVRSIVSSAGRRAFSCGYHPHLIVTQPIAEISDNKTLIDENQTYGKCTEKIQLFNGLSQVFSTENSTVDFIPRRTAENYGYYSYYRYSWRLEWTDRNEEEIEHRREFENPEKMKHVREKFAKYFIDKYKHYTEEQLNVYLQFAQRMKDNTVAFETFCSTALVTN